MVTLACLDRYLNPQSSLEQKCRVVVVFLMLAVWISFFFGFMVSFFSEESRFTNLIRNAGTLAMIAFVPFGLFRARNERFVSDFTVTYFIQLCGMANTYNSLFVEATRPTALYALVLMILIVVVNLPNIRLQCLCVFPGFVVMSYKCSFGLHGYPLIQLDDAGGKSGLAVDIGSQAKVFVLLPVVLGLVYTYCRAYRESARTMELNVVMVKEVSKYLAEYNIEGAEATLSHYDVDGDECDRKLVDVLSEIVQNLKRYKPFLPNYIVKNTIVTASDTHNVLDVPVEENHPVRDNVRLLQVPVEDGLVTMQEVRLLSTPSTRRFVSYAKVHFQYSTDDVFYNPQQLRVFIDKVYRTANLLSGAVHSCIGNTVHITWNAASIVSNPKRSAASALRVLSTVEACLPSPPTSRKKGGSSSSIQLSHRVDVYGSVMSGMADCMVTGTSHQTLLMCVEWSLAHSVLHNYCRQMKTNVICGATYDDSRQDCVIPIDVLKACGKPFFVYELTNLATQTIYGDSMLHAVEAYLSGDVGRAIRCLESRFDFNTQSELELHPESVQTFRKKLKRAALMGTSSLESVDETET
eukprot:PhF_6_TR16925/c0_g1_i2/m.25446